VIFNILDYQNKKYLILLIYLMFQFFRQHVKMVQKSQHTHWNMIK